MGRFETPNHLVFDTNELCNLQCVYCWRHASDPHANRQVPLSQIEKIMQQTVGLKLETVHPYNSGDPLLETRLPEIIQIIRKYNDAPIMLFTNGTAYANREVLMQVNFVQFTISAATPETYLKIHGRPLYHEAVKTLEWLEQQPNHPKIGVSFILTNRNIHEVDLWRKQWGRFYQSCSILVGMPHLKLPQDVELANCTPNYLPDETDMPCVFWDIFIINMNGDMQLCCGGAPGTFGNVRDTPLLEGWRKRCEYGLRAPVCKSCPWRAKNWEELL